MTVSMLESLAASMTISEVWPLMDGTYEVRVTVVCKPRLSIANRLTLQEAEETVKSFVSYLDDCDPQKYNVERVRVILANASLFEGAQLNCMLFHWGAVAIFLRFSDPIVAENFATKLPMAVVSEMSAWAQAHKSNNA